MRGIVANWKMNLLAADVEAWCKAFLGRYAPAAGTAVGVAAPFPYLAQAAQVLRPRDIHLFAQNGHAEAKGAYTGEVSMAQIQDIGCAGVILGHSERRQLFGETDAALARKVKAARDWNLLPLLCVGETLAEREAGRTLEVLGQQLSILGETGPGPLWVAYEPVWAIGTGLRAEAAQVQEAHAFIRARLEQVGDPREAPVPILYGVSVTPDNFPELLGIP